MSDYSATEQIEIESLKELESEVRALIGNPLSVWAVAATIESLGVREVDVRSDFGYSSIFELADHMYADLKTEIRREKAFKNKTLKEKLSSPGVGEQIKLFVKHYMQGLFFSVPMLSQIAAILMFRYSLWAWLEFNEAQATVVAFGTIAAFVITGGFLQVLGRSVSSYISSDNYFLAYEASWKVIKSGVITVGVMALIFYFINILIPFYPQAMVTLSIIYMILISFLLLGSGILYALKQHVSIIMIILAGTFAVIFNMEVLKLGIYVSQWLALILTIALLTGYGMLYFKLQIRNKSQNKIAQTLPDSEVRYFINYRYFIYGLSYFLFLFMDRILAWSAGEIPPPYVIWFNTPYELGMDWALLTLVLSIAVLEYSVHAFSKQLLPLQTKARLSQIKQFNSYFKKFYIKQLIILLIVGIASIAITYYSVRSLSFLQGRIPEIRDFFANIMTTKVFWLASISYLFLNIGLLHSLFFFTLNKPSFAMYSIIGGLGINFTVGYICSRTISLEYATMGLLAGSIAFAVISGMIAGKFFKRLDYYYYSAF